MKITPLIAVLAAVVLAGGCATTAPATLVEAREAYVRSSSGQAATLTPTELYDAKKALDRANKEFDTHGDTPELRDYSYIALRKIQLSDVKARTEADRQKIAEAAYAGVHVRDTQVQEAQRSLDTTQRSLDTTRQQLKDSQRDARTQREMSAADLEAERRARVEAEAKLSGALKDLSSIAGVKEEPRGMVVSLSDSTLFTPGTATLLNTARTRLNQVADALKDLPADRRMVVEAHTDAEGTTPTTQPLAVSRANAVREYLLARGVPADRLSAPGLAASPPATTPGTTITVQPRTTNGRVDIIIGGTGASDQLR